MPKKPIEMERIILADGWTFKTQVGSHRQYVHPLNPKNLWRYLMLSVYPACFFKEDSGYSVIFPDLNWLSTCGETLSEAMSAAVDCLAGYIYTSQKTNQPFALPSAISDIHLDKIAIDLNIPVDNAFVNMVTVDVELYAKEHFEKSVKKTLSIPAWLNKAAIERDINFSQTLQEALIKKISL